MQLKQYSEELRQIITDHWNLVFHSFTANKKMKQTSIFKNFYSLFWLSFQTKNIFCSFGTLQERMYAFLLRCVENEVKSVSVICISQIERDYRDEGVE